MKRLATGTPDKKNGYRNLYLDIHILCSEPTKQIGITPPYIRYYYPLKQKLQGNALTIYTNYAHFVIIAIIITLT